MEEILPLDSFIAAMRELPEFEGLSDDYLKSLYAMDYLPKMHAQKAPPPQQHASPPGLIANAMNLHNVGVPASVGFRPSAETPDGQRPAALQAEVPLWQNKDSSVSMNAEKELGGRKRSAVGLFYKKHF
jgi:hypothetical protein